VELHKYHKQSQTSSCLNILQYTQCMREVVDLAYYDYSVSAIMQAAALSLTLSADAFAAAFAYGCMGTKIPLKSGVIINIVCTAFLAAALFAGAYAAGFVPAGIGTIICFIVLSAIGGYKLYQGLRAGSPAENVNPSCPVTPPKMLKPLEAAILATGLSLDGLAAGFGAALGGVNAAVMLGSSLAAHMAAIPLGCMLGRQLSQKSRCNIAWVGGAVIIALAFVQLLGA
jgi:putative Mn2+ efflux pump MntP